MRRLVLVFFVVLVVVGVAGTVAGAKSKPDPSSYSQVVDNATKGRFEADGSWGKSSYGLDVFNESYRFARPAEDGTDARFRIEIPETGDYAVYARWPKVNGLNASVPIGIATASGVQWTRVNQQRNGGHWVRLGVYRMEAGDDYSVLFSRETSGTDYVGADAVKVEKVADSSKEPKASGSRGEEVVSEAKKWSGVRYRLGGSTRSPGRRCA